MWREFFENCKANKIRGGPKWGTVESIMRILSWNFQGLGRSQDLTIPRLKEIRKKYFPEILFLMETKKERVSVTDLQDSLGYDKVFAVEPDGYSGGLALLWKKEVKVEVKFGDKNVADCVDHIRDLKAEMARHLERKKNFGSKNPVINV